MDQINSSIPPITSKLYTLEEVAQILRVNPTTFRRWARLQLVKVVVLPQTQIGGRTVIRISQEVLTQLLTEQFLSE